MQSNKTAVLTALQTIEVQETPMPAIKSDEVLVKMEYCGVCGSDVEFFAHGCIGTNQVTYPFVLGKYQTHLPKVGMFFQFLKTPQGYFICIFIPFMLLILYQGINCITLFRRYKKEQLEEMQAEKEKIEAERLENLKMMAELQALKEEFLRDKHEIKEKGGDA